MNFWTDPVNFIAHWLTSLSDRLGHCPAGLSSLLIQLDRRRGARLHHDAPGYPAGLGGAQGRGTLPGSPRTQPGGTLRSHPAIRRHYQAA